MDFKVGRTKEGISPPLADGHQDQRYYRRIMELALEQAYGARPAYPWRDEQGDWRLRVDRAVHHVA